MEVVVVVVLVVVVVAVVAAEAAPEAAGWCRTPWAAAGAADFSGEDHCGAASAAAPLE
jgi:hypothetical protein